MSDAIPRAAGSAPKKWQYRFGMRFLLMTVLFTALVLGWVMREHRRAERRTALVAELAGVGVVPLLEEPTGLALLVKKVLPRFERPLGERFGRGWLERPTVVVCRQLPDEQVPFALERLKLLGTVREVHTQGPRLTPRGITELQSGLPGVDVVPSANPALHRYFRDQVAHEHLAFEGLKLVGSLALGLLGTLIFFAWPLMKRRRPRSSDG
jgi:4-amino-4-deoxy-L-arabinose transferase-like glycosyltransferase